MAVEQNRIRSNRRGNDLGSSCSNSAKVEAADEPAPHPLSQGGFSVPKHPEPSVSGACHAFASAGKVITSRILTLAHCVQYSARHPDGAWLLHKLTRVGQNSGAHLLTRDGCG